MRAPHKTIDKSFDWITTSVYLSLLLIGWFMVFSTLYDESDPYAFIDLSRPMGIQSLWVLLSLIVFVSVLVIDWKFWNTLAYPIYGVSLLLLVLVLIFGREINGAKAWFTFGSVSFQPAEWAKFATALAVASYLNFYKKPTKGSTNFFLAQAVFLIPILLIMLQPDLGSSLVFLSFYILLYRRGMSPILIVLGLSLGAIFVLSLLFSPQWIICTVLVVAGFILMAAYESSQKTLLFGLLALGLTIFLVIQGEMLFILGLGTLMILFYGIMNLKARNTSLITMLIPIIIGISTFSWGSNYLFDTVLKPHQQDRINVWLRPDKCDPRGSLYNILQSKRAIGSGGLMGKGFLKGEMTKLNYVPEQSTDFIFTTIGEEQGFIGSLGIILLFSILLLRCIIIAERASLEFVRNYAYGIFGIFLIHFTFNIGMTMGLLPVVGIPLPFISKGGSSLIAFTIMVGVLIKMDQARIR